MNFESSLLGIFLLLGLFFDFCCCYVCNVQVDLPKSAFHEREGPPLVPSQRPVKTRSENDAGKAIMREFLELMQNPFFIIPVDNKYVVMCYFGYWAQFRKDPAYLPIESIDTSLCTHMVYAFAGIDHESRLKALDPMNELVYQGSYTKFTNLKKSNPRLKILLSVGGWNEGSFRYSNMAGNLTARKTFAKTALEMLQKNNFDGLDLAWEYPSTRGGRPDDKKNFAALIQEVHQVLKPHNLLLTVALSANKFTIDSGYDVLSIAQ